VSLMLVNLLCIFVKNSNKIEMASDLCMSSSSLLGCSQTHVKV
jgi:hypothetical protein